MALRVRFQYASGASLGYSIERLADGLFYDFATSGSTAGTFTASPATPVAPLAADTGNFVGRYKVTLSSTPPAQFTDGNYCVTIHNTSAANAVVAELELVMHAGDDATYIPAASTDPWSQAVPGSYAAGTAGYALGMNLDVPVSSRLAASAYQPPPTDYQQRTQPVVLPTTPPVWYSSMSSSAPTVAQIVAGVWDEPRAGHVVPGSFGSCLDAAVSSRLAATADTPGTATLLDRLTAARAAYLDALNVSGAVASHADVAAIQISSYSLSPEDHAAITADAIAALNSSIPSSPTAGSVFDRIDARISSRSTYDGGPVASVTAPVVVGQNQDKSGYSLAAGGLDAVPVEQGINARQALSPILAATAGIVSGSGSGTITIQGGNVATTRILATTDSNGNRSTVVLNLPA